MAAAANISLRQAFMARQELLLIGRRMSWVAGPVRQAAWPMSAVFLRACPQTGNMPLMLLVIPRLFNLTLGMY